MDKKGKPYFLKLRIILLIFLTVIFSEFLFLANFLGRISFEDFLANITSEKLIELTNARRKDEGVKTLMHNHLLTSAAKMKANDMAKKGYFAHTSPEGIDPWYWIDKAEYDYKYAGENLAINFTESYQVDQAWMDSSTHRNNIINESFEDIGIATAVGEYNGEEATFVVQLFGKKREGQNRVAFQPERQSELIENDKKESAVLGEEKEQESFAFMEKKEDKESVLFISGLDEITRHLFLKEPKYLSFWQRLTSSFETLLVYFLVVIIITMLFSFFIKKIFAKEIYIPSVLINQLIIIITIFSAVLVKHYFLQIAEFIKI